MNWTEECLKCGFLLSGDDAYRGRTVKCPKCKQPVAIPADDDGGDYGLSPLSPEEQAKLDAEIPPAEAPGGSASGPQLNIRTKGRRVGKVRVGKGKVRTGGGGDDLPALADGATFDPTGLSPEALVHLPCPNGHVLEIERSLMGNWAMCPHCGEQFEMLLKNTQEHQRDQQMKEQREIARSSRQWMNYAIVAIVLVVIFLGLLIALAVAT
ncbi:MAG: hypothetical protein WD030_05595 [Pirellulales bacterium]